MSPLSHLNQSAGQSPLSDVERNSSHGGSTGGIPVEGFSGFNVVVSGISFVVVVGVVVDDVDVAGVVVVVVVGGVVVVVCVCDCLCM